MPTFSEEHIVIDLGSKITTVGISGEARPQLAIKIRPGEKDWISTLCKQIRQRFIILGESEKVVLVCERINLGMDIKQRFINSIFRIFSVNSIDKD
jgi:actin-related protein